MDPTQQSHSTFFTVVSLFVVACLVVGGAAYYLIQHTTPSPVQPATTQREITGFIAVDEIDRKIKLAYDQIETELTADPGDPTLRAALETFREVAMDPNASSIQRVRALNGINYAYTQSNFDAESLYEVVFSRPPFDQYYVETAYTDPDPLHPQNGDHVEGVELGLMEINKVSIAETPNHYALARLSIGHLFAYRRAVARNNGQDIPELLEETIEQIKSISDAYDALGDIRDVRVYSPPMRLHIMYARSGPLAFVGFTGDDAEYRARAERAFQEAIEFGSTYPQNEIDSLRILNGTLLSRIFYANYFWQVYKDSDPEKIKIVLRPLTDENAVRYTVVYSNYLPRHRNARVEPFTVLREIAAEMPELKAFLEGRGWTF